MIQRILPCLALAAVVGAAVAQNEVDANRKMAEAFFAKADAAIAKKDTTAFFSMFAESYYTVDTQGKTTWLADFKSQVVSAMKSLRNPHMSTTVKNVQLQNTEMVVWTEEKLSYDVKKGQGWENMVSTSRWAETLKKVDGQWKFGSSQELMTNEPWTFKTTH